MCTVQWSAKHRRRYIYIYICARCVWRHWMLTPSAYTFSKRMLASITILRIGVYSLFFSFCFFFLRTIPCTASDRVILTFLCRHCSCTNSVPFCVLCTDSIRIFFKPGERAFEQRQDYCARYCAVFSYANTRNVHVKSMPISHIWYPSTMLNNTRNEQKKTNLTTYEYTHICCVSVKLVSTRFTLRAPTAKRIHKLDSLNRTPHHALGHTHRCI